MNIINSLILGIVQGITEFLPISSSAHLVFLQTIFKLKENVLFFDILLHFSTLLAVIFVFYKDIITYLKSKKILFYILIATIPTGIIGLIIKKYFESIFSNSFFAAGNLVITGFLLFFSEKKYMKSKDIKIEILNIGWLKSLIIGIFQSIAVLPGISRSGATLAATMFLGIKKEQSVKFIFIMSIPAILAATMLEVKELIFDMASRATFAPVYIWGLTFAFVCGILSLKFLVNIVQNSKLKYFAYYCWFVGSFFIVLNYLVR